MLSHADHSPTLPQLTDFPGKTRHFNIAVEIGTKYHAVGTALLNDESGVIIPVIVSQQKDNAVFINKDILRRWVQGQGVTCSWRRLIQVLGLPCPKLARDIEESLKAEESPRVSMVHTQCTHSAMNDTHVDTVIRELYVLKNYSM